MNCEQISLKAEQLNIHPEDINIVKEPKNGWIIKSLTENKEIQNKIEQLKKYIYG